MDWSREQFTMDEHFTKAVLKVFVDLYNDGLIYRDKADDPESSFCRSRPSPSAIRGAARSWW